MSGVPQPGQQNQDLHHLQVSQLTFSVLECEEIGKDGARNIYDIDVVFDKGQVQKRAGFIVRADSLKVALEIIETLGQQTANMNEEAFTRFKSKYATTVFRTLHQSGPNGDMLTMYKDNRAHDGFKLVFGNKPAQRGVGPSVQLNKMTHLKGIDQLAKQWAPHEEDVHRKRQDGIRDGVNIALKKKNRN